MDNKVISSREIQRNYRGLVDRVKETGQAVYLGARNQPEAVLLGVDEFEALKRKALQKKLGWPELKKRLDKIKASGKQGISLAKFIHEDRQRH